MKLKLGLAALFLSVSVLLLQSNSFSKAEIRNDLALAVVSEDQSLIAITSWEGRIFVLQNNTDAIVDIESIFVMADGGVDDYLSWMMPGEARMFTLIGEAPELSGKEIQIIVSWETGRADIITSIPYFEEEVLGGVMIGGLLEDKVLDEEEVDDEKSVDAADKEIGGDAETKESVNPDTAIANPSDESN